MSDIAIVPVTSPSGAAISKKPVYLIILDSDGVKNKSLKKFICLDKPEFLNGFIQVKGIFSEKSEDEIIEKYTDILTSTSKDLFLEMMFPWHKICSIRSLVFKAK